MFKNLFLKDSCINHKKQQTVWVKVENEVKIKSMVPKKSETLLLTQDSRGRKA